MEKNKNMYLQLIASILLVYALLILGKTYEDSKILIYVLIFVIPIILVIDGFFYYFKYRKDRVKLILLTVLFLIPLIILNTKSNTLIYFLCLMIMPIIGSIIGWMHSKIKK